MTPDFSSLSKLSNFSKAAQLKRHTIHIYLLVVFDSATEINNIFQTEKGTILQV